MSIHRVKIPANFQTYIQDSLFAVKYFLVDIIFCAYLAHLQHDIKQMPNQYPNSIVAKWRKHSVHTQEAERMKWRT